MAKTHVKVEPVSASKLAEHLRAAEQAHAVYQREQLHGVRDENWADWYAKYIAEHMTQDHGE
jgi:hypothetical protein